MPDQDQYCAMCTDTNLKDCPLCSPEPRLNTTLDPTHPDFDCFRFIKLCIIMQTQLTPIQLNIAIHKIELVLGDFIDQDQCTTIMKIVETTLKTPITPEEQIFWEQNEPAMCSV